MGSNYSDNLPPIQIYIRIYRRCKGNHLAIVQNKLVG